MTRAGVLPIAGDPERPFALASVTKLLTAYATLVATEEGTVALEDAVGPPGATVAHLLSHASGLGPESASGVLAAPGARRIYSNAGVELLAAHVADRASMAFDAYLAEAVLAPLSMKASALEGSPAHGGRASLADLCAFSAELLAPRLLDPATLARATRPWFPGIPGVVPGFGWMAHCEWGLGFEVKADKSPHWTGSLNSPASVGHFGRSGTFLLLDPAAGACLVFLSDAGFGPWAKEAWPQLCDLVYGALGAL